MNLLKWFFDSFLESAKRFRAEANYPPFGLIAIVKIFLKQALLNKEVEPTLEKKGLCYEWKTPRTEHETISFAFVGDFGPLRNAVHLDQDVQNILKRCDYRFLNLEGPCLRAPRSNWREKLNIFHIDPTQLNNVCQNGAFNVLTLANNHILDRGRSGLDKTLQTLNSLELHSVSNTGTILPHPFFRIGAVGLCFETNAFFLKDSRVTRIRPHEFVEKTEQAKNFLKKMSEFRETVDFLVLSYHWGFESEFAPSRVQQECAKHIFDAGVDLIYGHHSHIVQPFEVMGNKVCFYSCGNFAMEEKKSEYREGVIFEAQYSVTPSSLALKQVSGHFVRNVGDKIALMDRRDSLAFKFFEASLKDSRP